MATFTQDNLKLLAVATLLGLSVFQVNRLVVKNLPKIKAGARIDALDPVMDPALLAVEQAAAEFGKRGVITSGLDDSPDRLPQSLHRFGEAVDARRVDWPKFDNPGAVQVQRNVIARLLGDDFDVVIEPNHLHIEHDPEVA